MWRQHNTIVSQFTSLCLCDESLLSPSPPSLCPPSFSLLHLSLNLFVSISDLSLLSLFLVQIISILITACWPSTKFSPSSYIYSVRPSLRSSPRYRKSVLSSDNILEPPRRTLTTQIRSYATARPPTCTHVPHLQQPWRPLHPSSPPAPPIPGLNRCKSSLRTAHLLVRQDLREEMSFAKGAPTLIRAWFISYLPTAVTPPKVSPHRTPCASRTTSRRQSRQMAAQDFRRLRVTWSPSATRRTDTLLSLRINLANLRIEAQFSSTALHSLLPTTSFSTSPSGTQMAPQVIRRASS